MRRRNDDQVSFGLSDTQVERTPKRKILRLDVHNIDREACGDVRRGIGGA